jgi:response regulator RpfG family c-di-GMP phosphodiesterase
MLEIRESLKSLKVLFVVKDISCPNKMFLTDFLYSIVNVLYVEEDQQKAFELFKSSFESQDPIQLVIIGTEIPSNIVYRFITAIRKINKKIPFIFISPTIKDNSIIYQKFGLDNYLIQPVNFKSLLKKIHNLCFVDTTQIDEVINEYLEKQHHSRKLLIDSDDIEKMVDLTHDFETVIANMLYNCYHLSYYQNNLDEIYKVLHSTYNLFYTFIDEDIQKAVGPFAESILSFMDSVRSIELTEDNKEEILEILILLLEDVLHFVERTSLKGEYIHSYYMLDSFLSNVEYLKLKVGLIEEANDDDGDLDFF